MTHNRVPIIALAIVVLAPITGCERGYKLAPVSGRILIDKRPVANVEVTFYPTNGKDLPSASGVTDAEGNYTLQAFVGNATADGAVVGESRVSFSMSRITTSKKTFSKDRRGGKDESVIPAKYRDSQLTFTVPPDGTKEANFDLSSR